MKTKEATITFRDSDEGIRVSIGYSPRHTWDPDSPAHRVAGEMLKSARRLLAAIEAGEVEVLGVRPKSKESA